MEPQGKFCGDSEKKKKKKMFLLDFEERKRNV